MDFLPFVCLACGMPFCQSHRFPADHGCAASQADSQPVCTKCRCVLAAADPAEQPDCDPQVLLDRHLASGACAPAASAKVPCSMRGCAVAELWAVECPGCRGRFCLQHRHKASHGCGSDAAAAVDRQRRHDDIKRLVDAKLAGLPQAAQRPAPKKPLSPAVRLMLLKLNCKGDAAVPLDKRVFLLIVAVPKQCNLKLFFHRDTIVGRLVDAVAASHGIRNDNNTVGGEPPLGLYCGESGTMLPFGRSLADLLASGAISQGSRLVLMRSSEPRIGVDEIPDFA
ncbi:hypothetical protein HK105_207779 [Polyrhizophydium stewartii]|uniref:AN1-type domain-containing protein n=1 Tax=Polyrhizophydium stewartii TaxID=2732419 RepID=A0ABR4MZG4_9FUNG